MNNKLLWVEKFGCILGSMVFSIMAFIALSEKEITTGSPKSSLITHSTGYNAITLGFLFFAGALACIGYLLKYTAFFRLYWFIASAIWLGSISWYLVYQV